MKLEDFDGPYHFILAVARILTYSKLRLLSHEILAG